MLETRHPEPGHGWPRKAASRISSRAVRARSALRGRGGRASDVAEALAALPGVTGHTAEQVEGRVRVQLDTGGDGELRPEIFSGGSGSRLDALGASSSERASLEQLFRTLTADKAGAVDSPEGDEPTA